MQKLNEGLLTPRAERVLLNKFELRELVLRYPSFEDCPLFVEVVAFNKV